MTAEGRLARGKANYDSNKFLKNSETLEYLESIKVKKIIDKIPDDLKSETKPKPVENHLDNLGNPCKDNSKPKPKEKKQNGKSS